MRVKLYEGMFLVDHNRARQSLAKIREEVTEIIAKAGGDVVNLEHWAERKLCYEVKRHRRGAFILSHFHAPPEGVAKIERSCRLSDLVLRALIVRDEDGPGIPRYSERGDLGEEGKGEPSGAAKGRDKDRAGEPSGAAKGGDKDRTGEPSGAAKGGDKNRTGEPSGETPGPRPPASSDGSGSEAGSLASPNVSQEP
jgi:small subunit ribosomal protein S6